MDAVGVLGLLHDILLSLRIQRLPPFHLIMHVNYGAFIWKSFALIRINQRREREALKLKVELKRLIKTLHIFQGIGYPINNQFSRIKALHLVEVYINIVQVISLAGSIGRREGKPHQFGWNLYIRNFPMTDARKKSLLGSNTSGLFFINPTDRDY